MLPDVTSSVTAVGTQLMCSLGRSLAEHGLPSQLVGSGLVPAAGCSLLLGGCLYCSAKRSKILKLAETVL